MTVRPSRESPRANRTFPRTGWLLAILIVVLLPLSLCGIFLRGCGSEHYRPPGHGDITFDVSSAGDAIVFNGAGTGGRDLYVFRLAASTVTRVADTAEYEVAPSFAPDGKSVVYAAGVTGDRADHIFVRQLDGAGVRQLTRANANDSSPRVSPDGTLVVFDRDKTYNWGGMAANWSGGGVICVVGIDGRDERQITADDTFAFRPWFLPDGKSVAYSTLSGVHSVPLDRSEPPKKVVALAGAHSFASSSDGGQLVFIRGQFEQDQELWTINSDGTGKRRVTPARAAYACPVFSHDGEVLYFFLGEWPSGPTGIPARSIWRIDVDGTNLQKVASRQLFDQPLDWKPEASTD
jgi:Tol biopolymer transport system component